ncbi:MAG: hypothetical protein QY326_09905 [Bdellovibrionota bacterium]|nr:MAG: hypothetical protein QY326_09905 [Bdellovibrionota bacterium]
MAATTAESSARPWKRRFDGARGDPIKTWSNLKNAEDGIFETTCRLPSNLSMGKAGHAVIA